MSTSPITDALEIAYWNGDANVRDVFTEMGTLEAQLAAERAKVEQLRWAILSVMPDGPYDPILEPEWLYCAEAIAATEPTEGNRAL